MDSTPADRWPETAKMREAVNATIEEGLFMSETPEPPPPLWAVVEVFGHGTTAGLLTAATIGGCHFVRVYVPRYGENDPYEELYGPGAIFRITPRPEDEVLRILTDIQPRRRFAPPDHIREETDDEIPF